MRKSRRAGAEGFDCTYCGMNAAHMDHVVPKVYSNSQSVSRDCCVPACAECNQLLRDFYYVTVAERAGWLAIAIARKHKKLLGSPDWREEDYECLEGRLLRHVKAQQFKKVTVRARISFAETVSALTDLSLEGVWAAQNSKVKEFIIRSKKTQPRPLELGSTTGVLP